jgi:hypothetical protein
MCVPFSDKLKFFDKFIIKGREIINEDPSYLIVDFRII